MKHRLLVLLICCSVIGVVSFSASAMEPAQLSAEQLTYTAEDFWGRGNVVFKYKSLVISSDSFHLDKAENVITFSGNVLIDNNANWTRGKVAVYALDSRELIITDAISEMTAEFLSEPAFVKGEEISISDSSTIIAKATATTCDLETPHYHIRADVIEIYPDEYMVLRNVRFYDGSLALFMFPYFLMPLTEDSAFEFPRFGSSFDEGLFVKTTFAYYLSRSHHGAFLIDYMEKKGLGLGIRHLYKINNGSGSVYLYHILNSYWMDPQDFQFQISHVQTINENMTVSGWLKYQQYLSANLSAEWSFPKSSWKVDMTYSDLLNRPLLQKLKGAVIIEQQIGDSANISSSNTLTADEINHSSRFRYNSSPINITLTNSLRAIVDNKLDGRYRVRSASTYLFADIFKARTIISVGYREQQGQSSPSVPTGYATLTYPIGANTSMQIRSSRYANYNRDQISLSGRIKETSWSLLATATEPKGNLVVLDEYPEITFRAPKLSLGKYTLPIDLSLRLGRMIEKPTLKEAVRSDVSLNYASNSIDVTDRISFRINGYTRYTGYIDLAQRLAVNLQTAAQMQFTDWLSATSTYTNRKVYGRSPFQSDQLEGEHSIANYVHFSSAKASANINAKYDIAKKQLGTIWSTAQYTISPNRYISLTTNYDPRTSRFTDVTAGMQIGLGSGITVGGYINRDLLGNKTKYMSFNADASIGKNTEVAYSYRLSGYSSTSASTETQSFKLQSKSLSVRNEISRNLSTNTVTMFDIAVRVELPFGWTVEHNELRTKYTQESTTSITKDLHCREIQFFYEHINQAFWFQYRIKGLNLDAFRTQY